ncbi:hypothetical protein [Rhodohalobacter sp.]|uniref:hypothetical protein n=1 Tax=Rhodohalobacter sp. TaxID=1974210 RepID=UPI002ACE3259|nr:hypothetical protein [Rhodohalobacter sp.]MDZ7755535.1 hypothetical protein [Rhodohalobacter sp.]
MFKIKNILSIISAVIFSLTITADAISQNNLSEEQSERLEQSLYYGLSSDVNGVIESTLFNMLNYKIVYPEFHSDKVMEKAGKIAEETTSETISSKANLVIYYYENLERFPESDNLVAELDHMNQDRIFEYLRNGDHSGQFTSKQK